MSTNQQIAPLISKELKELKEKIKTVKKLKGEQKMIQSDKIKRGEVKRINNLITTYRVFIATTQQDAQSQQIQKHKKQAEEFQTSFNDIRKNLDYIRNQGIAQENLYADRNPKKFQGNSRQQLIKESFQDQQNMKDGVKRILVNLYEADSIMKNTNIQLMNQIEKLDSIYDELEQADSSMRRAMKHISYFAKSVYTDKIMMGMIVVIVLAIIVIIVLSAMGKTGGSSSDVLTQ